MGKFEKNIISLCLIYIIYVFLYGIIIKITFSNSLLFHLKTYIPEMILLLIVLMDFLKNGVKVKSFSLILLGYSAIILFINLIIYGLNEQALYWLRDLYIPLVAFCCLLMINFSREGMKWFFSKITLFFKVYLVIGFMLALIQQIQGWEWASSFYTGYIFYGQDEVSKIKIAHNMGLLRAPSLSGNFATFGYYCLMAGIVIDASTRNFWKQLLWDIIALLCMVLATNKSAIVAFAVVLILRYTIDFRSKSIRINTFIYLFVISFVILTTMLIIDDGLLKNNIFIGLFARLDVWKEIVANTSILEIFIPYKQFMYGSGIEGGAGFFDNTYLYSLFTQGIIGTVLWIYMLSKVYITRMKNGNLVIRQYVYELTIALFVLGITVNITQGRGFFSPCLVLIGMGYHLSRGREYFDQYH